MRQRWKTGRVEAFSDGVLAIAITLLVLDINVPDSAFDDLASGIADQWPSYLAYVTSFLAIGAVWLEHHTLFNCLRSVDSVIMRLNLGLLLFASFLPFPTRLAADAITHGRGAERSAVILYGVTLLIISVLLDAMWRYAARHRDLLREDVTDAVVRAAEGQPRWALAFYAAGTVAGAVFLPRLAAFSFLAVAVWSVATARGERGTPGVVEDEA